MVPICVFWGILLVVSVVAEVCTQQLVSIWFAAGALVACFAALFGASTLVQVILFLAVSIILLILTRPILKRVMRFHIQDNNLKQDLGKYATVIQAIDPMKGTGRVRLEDVDWIAISSSNTPIPEGTTVRVDAVDGTKLHVTAIPQTEPVSAAPTEKE